MRIRLTLALFLFSACSIFITIRDGVLLDSVKGWHPPNWHRIVVWPEGATVWVILITLWFIALQEVETAKSVKVGQDAATAAQKQADHIVASERAWIVIGSSMIDGFLPVVGSDLTYWWSIKNTGNTPAQVKETQCCYELIKNYIDQPLPLIPKYPAPIRLSGFLLPPGGTADYLGLLLNETGQILKPGDLDHSDVNAIRSDLYRLRVYGYVKYFDVFGSERESRFCEYYVWPLPERPRRAVGFRPLIGAPAEYTKCT